MEQKPSYWDDVFCNVLTEMDRTMAVLQRRYSSAPEALVLIKDIDAALHEKLRSLDDSAKEAGITNGNSQFFELHADDASEDD